jgi:hypothetical protein
MKKNSVFGMLALGLVLAGCATSTGGNGSVTGGRGDDGIPKTIIIKGFNPQLEGTWGFGVEVTGDWDDEQDGWIIPAISKATVDGKPNVILDGQTLTIPLWNNDDNELLTRWTGTGEYSVNINIYPRGTGTVKAYRYHFNTGNESVNIKDAETMLEWSDFVFGWDWEKDWEGD